MTQSEVYQHINLSTRPPNTVSRLSSIASIFAFISVLIQDPLWGCTLVILEQRLKQNVVNRMCRVFITKSRTTFTFRSEIFPLSLCQGSQQSCLLRKAPQTNSHVRAKHCAFCVFDIPGPDSIDQHAFKDVPEVGAAPDMIYDDLPSNPDYLDVSFGAAAGLRELDDDDLDMDDQSRSELTGGIDSPSYSAEKGVISSVGGETVRLLDPNGLHVVENFFNTLPALVESSPQ